jgi:RNA polymerase subunit RPABC4/transcription elongation factor Spt4
MDRGNYERVWGAPAARQDYCPKCGKNVVCELGWDIHDQRPTVRGKHKRCPDCHARMRTTPEDETAIFVATEHIWIAEEAQATVRAKESHESYKRQLKQSSEEVQRENRRRLREQELEQRRKANRVSALDVFTGVSSSLWRLGCLIMIAGPVLILGIVLVSMLFK